MAAMAVLAAATGFAWLAVPAAIGTGALAAGAVVLEVRARRDADVMLHAAPLTGPVGDAETSAVLARRAAALTAPKHLRALAEAVRAHAHGTQHLLVPQAPAARLLARHADVADRIAAALDRRCADVRAIVELEWLLSNPRPSEDSLRRVDRLLAA
jgi:delta 1-pyrroline-5-carboxylate dehydrogenase